MSAVPHKPAVTPIDVTPSLTADVILPLKPNRLPQSGQPVIAIGSSTGGTEALRVLLTALPASMPPILVTQHMPEMFTRAFAARLDTLCALHVKEAEDGERLREGTVYIAPGHSHLMVRNATPGGLMTALSSGEPVNRHRPSVDVLFRSVANVAARQAIGVILTGMGRDGAAGMLEMRQAGAWNLAQDEKSCVVFGMPKEAIALGGAQEVLPLDAMAARLVLLARQRQSAS